MGDSLYVPKTIWDVPPAVVRRVGGGGVDWWGWLVCVRFWIGMGGLLLEAWLSEDKGRLDLFDNRDFTEKYDFQM